MADLQALDYALRVCESIAFSLHSAIGLTEPCHGIGRGMTADSLPVWFFQLAGLCLATVAALNFLLGDTAYGDWVVLAAQMWVIAFHSGAVATHSLVGHHPVAAGAPAVFVVMAFLITSVRVGSFFVALLATAAFALLGVKLATVMVNPRTRVGLLAAGGEPACG
mmetsp:Transcript_82636/g.242512  ORF Transcript_82636/g.242512 Transcript_82636/m.242512 type:complete len:165 (+) Transcript_82636:44-538(+)